MPLDLPEIGSTGWLVLGALAILLVGWGVVSRAAHRRRVRSSTAGAPGGTDGPGAPPPAPPSAPDPPHDPSDRA